MNIIRGDTLIIAVPITNKNGDSINIEDITELYLTCREKPDKNSKIIFQKEKSDFTFEDNKYKVDLLAEDTEQLSFAGNSKNFYFDVEVTTQDMRKSKIYEITIDKDYTIHGGDDSGN